MVKVKEEKQEKMLPGEGPEYGMTNNGVPAGQEAAPPPPAGGDYGGEYGGAPTEYGGSYQ